MYSVKNRFALIIILLTIQSFVAESQVFNKYNKLFIQYKKSIKEQDLEKVIGVLWKLEKRSLNKNYYLGSIMYYANKNKDSVTFLKAMEKVNLLDSFFVSEQLKMNYTVISNWQNTWLKSIKINQVIVDSSLSSYFERIEELETRHRSKINKIYLELQKVGFQSEIFKARTDSIFKLQNPLDSLSHKLFDRLVDSLGRIPSLKEIGMRETHTIFIVLQHYKSGTKKTKYIRALKKHVLSGCFPTKFYAQIVDRDLLNRGKQLMFGITASINQNGEVIRKG